MRQHIQDNDRLYSFLLPVVKRATRRCFRGFHVSNWEKVPSDGSVIFVTNHTCSLMDPLVMLLAEGKKVVFMARADMFRKKAVARILRWLRILPIYRIRDGVSAVKANSEAISEAVGVLRDRCPLCLYPEGTHRPKHSLLPLGKGVCHIAFEAAREIGDKWPVYIVPAGIEYSDYFRFRPDVELTIGDPINITEFLKEETEAQLAAYQDIVQPTEESASAAVEPVADQPKTFNEARAMNALRERLTQAMRSLITWIPDDDHYEAIWEQTQLYSALSDRRVLWKRKGLNQERIREMLKLREWHPGKAARLFSDTLRFKKERECANVSVYSTRHPDTPITGKKKYLQWSSPVLNTLITSLWFPLWLGCALLMLPVWLPAELLAAKAKDAAWRNTRRFGVCFILKPLTTVLIALFSFLYLPWQFAAFLTLVSFAGMFLSATYDGAEFMRRLTSDWRWLFNARLRRMHDGLRI